MGRLSDRDATIIMVLLVVAIVALPYTLYIKDTRVKTEQLKAEAVTLEARLEQIDIKTCAIGPMEEKETEGAENV